MITLGLPSMPMLSVLPCLPSACALCLAVLALVIFGIERQIVHKSCCHKAIFRMLLPVLFVDAGDENTVSD